MSNSSQPTNAPAKPGPVARPMNFQTMVAHLQDFWAKQNCAILFPIKNEVGAGTFHPATTIKCLGKKPWRAAYIQECYRPGDGRYGTHPNRLCHYYQFQVLLKPSPDDSQKLFLESLKAIGLDANHHDIRFVEDDWQSPTLGAAGLGWEVWCDGMEVAQFTYFQQMGGLPLALPSTELTYGLERLAMFCQGVENVYDLDYGGGLRYGDLFQENEETYSRYYFELSDANQLAKDFKQAEENALRLLGEGSILPAYDHCMQASHLFNMLEARGAVSVSERQAYIDRVRTLVAKIVEAIAARGQ